MAKDETSISLSTTEYVVSHRLQFHEPPGNHFHRRDDLTNPTLSIRMTMYVQQPIDEVVIGMLINCDHTHSFRSRPTKKAE